MNAVVTSCTVRGSVFRASFCDHPLGSQRTLKVVRQGPGSITLTFWTLSGSGGSGLEAGELLRDPRSDGD